MNQKNRRALTKFWQMFVVLFAIVAIPVRGQTSLPGAFSIEPPASTVPAQAAAFSGAWSGIWAYALPSTLIVEQISSNGAVRLIYSWGDSPEGQSKAGWTRQTGQISNGNLQFTMGGRTRLDFAFEPDGALLGRYELQGYPPSFTTLHRIQSTNTDLIRIAAGKVPGGPRIQIRDDGLRGTLFLPTGNGPWPGVILLGGSEGGMLGTEAAFLATKGDAALALAYFRYEDLPKSLENIPLEYFQTAIRWLQARSDVRRNDIAVLGVSRGGELALLLGATFPEIRAVVAISPSSVVWGGFGTNADANSQPAWTYHRRPLPFMDNHLSREQQEEITRLSAGNPFDEVPWFQALLDNKAAVAKAAIPVEKINGPVLFISGNDDKIWPSTQMSDMAMQWLRGARHPFPDRHLAYPGAGHYIPLPNMAVTTNILIHPVTKEKLDLGGDTEHTAAAAADAWPQIINFLNQSVSPAPLSAK